MDRREFLKKFLNYSIAGASSILLSRMEAVFGKPRTYPTQKQLYDLIAIRGSTPDKMFDAGIKELGGMKNFIRKGDVVVVKPNIGWNSSPESGANTNPLLVGRIVKHCVDAGAKKVYVFDHTATHWKGAYQNSGIEKAAKETGASVIPADSERYYQEVTIPGAHTLKTTKVHELVLSADILINVPVLKTHWSARLTSAIKNLMGVVWDRWYYHSSGLHQCISDFCLLQKPTLNVVDAYTVMYKNGPQGYSRGDLILKKMQLISTDPVAIDAASAKILEMEPSSIRYISLAHKKKLGNMNLDKLRIKKIAL